MSEIERLKQLREKAWQCCMQHHDEIERIAQGGPCTDEKLIQMVFSVVNGDLHIRRHNQIGGSMSTLYELTEEALALRATLEDAEGDLDALGRQFAATLDANDAELARKLDGYCALILDYEARNRIHAEAAEAQIAKAQHCSKQSDWLSDNLRHALERLGIKKHDGVYRASVCKNSTVPVLIDEAAVPEQYKRVKVDIDRLAIRDALKSGATLPFARWGEAGTHLRVS